jgi:hypothetical protein
MGKKEKLTFKEALRLQDEKELDKIELAALKSAHESADWVHVTARGERQMNGLLARGWEIVKYPSSGVYRDWIKQYGMRKGRDAFGTPVDEMKS